MFEDGNNGVFVSVQLYFSCFCCVDDDYFYFDDVSLFVECDDFVLIEVEVGGGDVKLVELFELVGVFDFVYGVWFCEVVEDGVLDQVFVCVGVVLFNEIVCVVVSVCGLINLFNVV